MHRGLTDPYEMRIIYNVSKAVYDGEYSIAYALRFLKGKVAGTEASLKMYFNIYSCMRKARCYKMGTSEAFTKFLLDNIYLDFGKEAYINALIAVKGNYAYRKSVNNTQPGLIRACKSSIQNCSPDLVYEDIPTASIISKRQKDKIDKNRRKSLLSKGTYSMSDNYSNTYDVLETVTETTFNSAIQSENEDTIELNIQPAASILNVFSRLSYKPWYAIAEFVDNSTQSYLSHMKELASAPNFKKLVVKVKYDNVTNTLTIKDNAYGMELERFRDAILLDSRNSSQTGRNEFGMGLKTAASWFGNVWTVTSTQYGSKNRYTATVDIPKLKEYSLNSIQIYRNCVTTDTHGTQIVIEQVTKKITGARTIAKIRDLLSSMYRRDINSRNIEIWFNDEPIVFDEYPILTNFRGKSWKKNLNFDVEFLGQKYEVTGFVAIMNPGSFPKAGFALFRQDRVVVGGTDNNYKPSPIFGQAQSQVSLKLFGELNMDDFPVNQAKDGFIWDDGLEDVFIDTLKDNIQEYIEIAKMSIKERADEERFSIQASFDLQRDVEKALSNAFSVSESDNIGTSQRSVEDKFNDNKLEIQNLQESKNDIQEYIDTVLKSNVIEEKTIGTVRNYCVAVSTVINVNFSVQWARGNKSYWIDYKETKIDTFDVRINIDHPFFMPFTKDENFQRVLEKFVLAFILAERQAKLSSNKEGYIKVSTIKNHMNKYLEKLAEDK